MSRTGRASFALIPIVLFVSICGPALAQDPIVVHCLVFHDLNQDGLRQPLEPGLPDIRVTNGLDVMTTDGGGHLDVTVDRDLYRFVAITVPAGHWPSTPFYHWVPVGEAGPDTVAFGLRSFPETAADPVQWVHLADTHVNDWAYRLDEELSALAERPRPPLFAINCGDLTEVGADTASWEIYCQMTADSPTPVLNVPGCHDDLHDGSPPLALYEQYCGPPYYSFEAGSYHYIIYCDPFQSGMVPAEDDWLDEDVAATPAGLRLLVFNHHLLRQQPPARIQHWAELGITGAFSGHWHGINITTTSWGITEYNMSISGAAPRDRTPRMLAVVTCEAGGAISYEMRRTMIRHRLVLAHPDGYRQIGGPDLTVMAQLYDTVFPAVEALAWVEGAGGSTPATSLRAEGISLWRGSLDVSGLPAGEYTVRVTGSFADGVVVAAESQFARTADAPLTPAPGQDWPMIRHDARGTGFVAGSLRPPLELAWAIPLPGMVAMNSPVVAGGRVYMGYRAETGPGDAGILACDARTGEILWTKHLRGGTALAPAVTGGLVITTALSDSVYGLDADSGAILWSLPTPAAYYDQTAPIFEGPYAWVSGEPYTYCVDWTSGSLVWSSPYLGRNWSPRHYSSPVLGEDRLCHGLYGLLSEPVSIAGGLSILDRGSGGLLTPVELGDFRSPIWSDGRMYVIGAADLLHQRLEARGPGGGVLWTSPTDLMYGTSAPALGHGIIVVGGPEGKIMAFDSADGRQLWAHEVDRMLLEQCDGIVGRATYASAAIADSVVFIGSLDGNLYALDLFSGAELDRFRLGAPIASSAAVSGTMVFVGACDGHLYGLVGRRDDPTVGVGGADEGRRSRFAFAPPAPNPVAADCLIAWELPAPAAVRVEIFDLRGRRVRELLDAAMPAGPHRVVWDGRDQAGRIAANGSYLVRVAAGREQRTRRVLMIR